MIEWIVAGATSLTSLGAIIWLTAGRISDREKLADARIAQVETEAHAERAAFELEVATKALAAEKKRTAALQEVLDDVSKAPIGIGLTERDWQTRLLRITQSWGDSEAQPIGTDGSPSDKDSE